MIVPTYRLLFWTGLLLVPLAILVAAIPLVSALFLGGLAGLFLILVIADAILAFGRLDGIHLELPDVIRMSKDRLGEILIRIHNTQQTIKRLRIGLPFPQMFLSTSRDMTVELPKDSEISSLPWPCIAQRRGNFRLDTGYLEASSPLSFWAYRKKIPIQIEIRVYPDLFKERKDLAFLFQNRGIGIHSQRQLGKGRDFEQLREYMPGDSYEDIHWKATAKRLFPITKVFQIERTQEIYVIIDASRMSTRKVNQINGRGQDRNIADTATMMERYISAALIMALVTQRQGDLFGLITFSNNIDRFIRAKSGKFHFDICRDALYTLQARKVTPDFSELLSFISLKIRRRALLIFLTSLDDPVLADGFVQSIHIVSKKHLVMVNMINPGMADPLFISPDVQSTDDIYWNLGGHIIWDKLHDTEKRLKKRGIGFSILDNEKMNIQLISQYLNIKKKQIL